jgi:hypothetical protein
MSEMRHSFGEQPIEEMQSQNAPEVGDEEQETNPHEAGKTVKEYFALLDAIDAELAKAGDFENAVDSAEELQQDAEIKEDNVEKTDRSFLGNLKEKILSSKLVRAMITAAAISFGTAGAVERAEAQSGTQSQTGQRNREILKSQEENLDFIITQLKLKKVEVAACKVKYIDYASKQETKASVEVRKWEVRTKNLPKIYENLWEFKNLEEWRKKQDYWKEQSETGGIWGRCLSEIDSNIAIAQAQLEVLREARGQSTSKK